MDGRTFATADGLGRGVAHAVAAAAAATAAGSDVRHGCFGLFWFGGADFDFAVGAAAAFGDGNSPPNARHVDLSSRQT